MGFSSTVGIGFPLILKMVFNGFPFLITKLLDFAGLNFIRAQVNMATRSSRVNLPCCMVLAMIVISSMNARVGGCTVPDLDIAPLLRFSVLLMRKFTVSAKIITDIVQPVIMPISRSCHAVVYSPTVNRILNVE